MQMGNFGEKLNLNIFGLLIIYKSQVIFFNIFFTNLHFLFYKYI